MKDCLHIDCCWHIYRWISPRLMRDLESGSEETGSLEEHTSVDSEHPASDQPNVSEMNQQTSLQNLEIMPTSDTTGENLDMLQGPGATGTSIMVNKSDVSNEPLAEAGLAQQTYSAGRDTDMQNKTSSPCNSHQDAGTARIQAAKQNDLQGGAGTSDVLSHSGPRSMITSDLDPQTAVQHDHYDKEEGHVPVSRMSIGNTTSTDMCSRDRDVNDSAIEQTLTGFNPPANLDSPSTDIQMHSKSPAVNNAEKLDGGQSVEPESRIEN